MNEAPAPQNKNTETIKKIQAHYQRGEYDRALAVIETTTENKLNSAERTELWNLHGLVYLGKKRPEVAESSFKKVLAINGNPAHRGYYEYNLAVAQYEQQKTAETLTTLEKIDPTTLDKLHLAKANTLKERALAKSKGIKPSKTETPVPPATEPSTVATGLPAAEPAITPVQVYDGPVSKRKIGVLLPLTGKYESFGLRARQGIEVAFAIEDPDQDYQLIFEDAGETLGSQQEALKKLVEEQEVIAVIGPMLSKDLEKLSARAEYYQVPLISIAQAQKLNAPFLFSCSISNKNQISRVVQYAMESRGYKKFALLAPNNRTGNEMANIFWDEVVAREGEVVGHELYEPSSTDFREPIDKLLGLYYTEARKEEVEELAKARTEMNITKKTTKTAQYFNLKPILDFDAVFIADEAKTVGQIIPTFAYRDADKINFLGISTWNSNQLISRAKEFAEGALFPVGYNPLSQSADIQNFIQKFQEKTGSIPGEMESVSFDAATLALKALKERPSSREEFKTTLEGIQNFSGSTGTTQFSEHQCSRELSLYQVEKGRIVPVK